MKLINLTNYIIDSMKNTSVNMDLYKIVNLEYISIKEFNLTIVEYIYTLQSLKDSTILEQYKARKFFKNDFFKKLVSGVNNA